MSKRKFEIKCDIDSFKNELRAIYGSKSGKDELDVNSNSQCDHIKQNILNLQGNSDNSCLINLRDNKKDPNKSNSDVDINNCINSVKIANLFNKNKYVNLSIEEGCARFYIDKMPNRIKSGKFVKRDDLSTLEVSYTKQIEKYAKTVEGSKYQKCLSGAGNNVNKLLKCNDILINSLLNDFKNLDGLKNVKSNDDKKKDKNNYASLITLIFIFICILFGIYIMCNKRKVIKGYP